MAHVLLVSAMSHLLPRPFWVESGPKPLRAAGWKEDFGMREGKRMRDNTNNANVRFPPPLIYLSLLVLGIFAGRRLHLPRLGLESNLETMIGLAVMLIGTLVIFSAAGLFVRYRTAIIPHKPATRLVTTGIFHWTRNPMYLGMALLYCGLAIFFDSLLGLLLLPVVLLVIQTQVMAKEEAYLERTFGDEYRAYKTSVRRWI